MADPKYVIVTTLVASVVLSGCGGSNAAVNVLPTLAPTGVGTQPTREPAVAPAPSAPSRPTLVPSATPQPAAVPTAVPTATLQPSPLPTSTSEPSPLPTSTPEPTAVELVYVFPVQGSSVEYAEYHHDYPASDIFCPVGSAFVAPTSGVVDFVSVEDVWDATTNKPEDRGGLSIAMVGDDGVRYYGSHLSEIAAGIKPGVRVAAGDLLGRTGKSGNAAGTPPHLHFGISRPTTPDDWKTRRGEVSPYPYLKAWARGETITPALR